MGRTAAQALIEEGKEIGIEQGVLQARQEALLDFIQSKFALSLTVSKSKFKLFEI